MEDKITAGLIGYGAYIPRFRLKVEDIWDAWIDPVNVPAVIFKRKALTEKAVNRWDEDSVTMAIQAAKASLEIAGLSGIELGAIYFGSCTNPCVSRAAAVTIAEALQTTSELLCTDCQFSTKSGTAALQICIAMADAEIAKYSLAIGSDALSRHIAPNDRLEYSASSGASAFIIGTERLIAKFEGIYSYTTQTPEFFRLDGERYIKHASGEEEQYLWGYTNHVKRAIEGYFKKYGNTVNDFSYVTISQPDGRLPVENLE